MEDAPPPLAAGAGVADGVAWVFPLAAEGLAGVAPALAAVGVGVGDGLFPAGCWPLEFVLCAVAMATMHVASARIRMSFISVPLVVASQPTPFISSPAPPVDPAWAVRERPPAPSPGHG